MGKLKRNICRFLIASQIYGNVFQGIAHAADLADNNGIRNHIHLASFIDQTGNRRLALGTDDEDGRFTFLKSIDVPSSDTLDLPIKKVSTELLDGISDTTSVNGDDDYDDNLGQGSDDGSSTTASIGGKGYFKSKTIVYKPQGNCLTLQGLKIYIDHDGAMRLEGRQNLEQDKHRKLIFLSSDKSITLDGVMAHELILNAPQLNNYNKSLIGHLGIGSDDSQFTNFGNMTIIKLAESPAFEVMDNLQVMMITQGNVKAKTFSNFCAFAIDQGSLLVNRGTNRGPLKVDSLEAEIDFTNEEDGKIITPLVSGTGKIDNLGTLETEGLLKLDIDQFINQGLIKAQAMIGSTELQRFINYEEASVEVAQALGFADKTNLINAGTIETQSLDLNSDRTTIHKSGIFRAPSISLTGTNPFTNHGQILANQKLVLNLPEFTNLQRVESPSIDISQVTNLTNAKKAVIDAQGSDLSFGKDANVINDGNLKARNYIFDGGSLVQGGRIDGRSLKIGIGTDVTTTDDQTINLSGELWQCSHGQWPIRGTINAYQWIRYSDINLYGTLNIKSFFTGRGTIHPGGKLTAKYTTFCDGVLLNGELITDILDFEKDINRSARFVINGKALIRHSAKICKLKVGEHGKLHGYQNSLLSLSLAEDSEIAGLVAIDVLVAAKQIKLTEKGVLVSRKKTDLQDSFAIAQEAEAVLHDLKIAGDITNHGQLQIVGIQPNQDVIRFANNGIASIDANQPIPVVKKDQPQNLAWLDCELNREQATKADNYLNACFEFFNGTTAGKDFLKERVWLPSQVTKVDPIEQYRLWCHDKYWAWRYNSRRLNPKFRTEVVPDEEYQYWYQRVYQAPLEVSRLVTETVEKRLATISEKREARKQNWEELFGTTKPIKLQLDNQTTGKLTLKSGRFSFAGNNALVNEGTLTQDRAYVHWRVDSLDGLSGGIWQAKGSLGLLDYTGYNVGKLGVEETLHVSASRNSNFTDGIQVLEGLKQCKAQKVIVYADKIKNELTTSNPVKKSYPWPLELRINGDVDNSFEILAPELSIYAHNLKTIANLFATLGLLHLDVDGLLDIEALIFGKKATFAKAQQVKIFGRETIITWASGYHPFSHEAHYKLNGNGVYSEGRITLDIGKLINNYYGTIQGSAYTITTPQLINLAGLIVAIDLHANSEINVKALKNLRDALDGNQAHNHNCGLITRRQNTIDGRPHDFGLPCAVPYHYHETSDEAVIASNGDFIINYHTLEMLVSSITSYANLTLFANGVSLQNPGEGDMLPGTTTMTKRNWQINRIVGKAGIKADLGNANMATSMYGENIRVKAAWLTLQSLGLTPQQQIQIYDLVTECFNNNAYKNENGNIDTVIPWEKSQDIKTMVVLGEKAIEQMGGDKSIKVPISLEAIEQQTKNLFFRFNRGIDGMGSNIGNFFNNAFVRNHPGTISQKGIITFGGSDHEIEYLINSTLTAQDVLKHQEALAYVEFKYNENLNNLNNQNRVASFLNMGMNPGLQGNRCIQSPGEVDITSENGLNIFTSVKGLRIRLSTNGNLIIGSDVMHFQNGSDHGGDYWQVLDQTTIKAVKDLLIEGKSINFKAVNTSSGTTTNFLAKGHIIDEAVKISSKRSWGDEDGQHLHKTTRPQVSNHESGGNITSIAEGAQHLSATNFKCEVLRLTGLDGVDFYEVHNVDEYQHITQTEGDAIKNTVTKVAKDQYAKSRGSRFTVSESVHISSFGNINITNPSLFTPKTTLESLGGVVKILQGTDFEAHQTMTMSQNMAWQSAELKGSSHKTYTGGQITGELLIISKQNATLQKVFGQVLDYADRIKIEGGGKIVFEDVHEEHKYYCEKQEGPTAALAALVALAITIASSGAAADLGGLVVSSATATMGATTAGVLGIMTTAAFTSISVQAGTALLNNKGDVGKAAKELASTDSLKKIGKDMLKAGLFGNGGSEISLRSLAMDTVRNTLTSAIFEKENIGKAFVQGFVQAGVKNVTGYLAEKIGDAHTLEARNLQGTNDGSQVALHTVSGGIGGGLNNVLNGRDIELGITSGITGGFTGSLTTKILSSDSDTAKQRENKTKWADGVAIGVGFLLKQDVNIVYQASNNANVHNELKHMETLKALDIIKEGEEVYEGEEPLTPRTKAGLDGVKIYDQMKNSPGLLAEYIERHEATGSTREGAFQDAYDQAERNIVIETGWKKAQGSEISNYEINVVKKYAIDCGISLVGSYTVAKLLGTLPTLTKYAKGFLNKKAGSDLVSSHIKFKNPGQPANSNFVNRVHSNHNRQPSLQSKVVNSDCLGNQKHTTQNLADNINNKHKSNNTFQQKKEFYNQPDDQPNNFFQQKKPVENVLTHRIDGSKIPDTQIGGKHVSQNVNKNNVVQKSEVVKSLDWSIHHPKTTKGDTAHHIRTKHEQLSLSKADQGVFYGDPVKTVEEAWAKAQIQGIKPSVIGETDVYVVPRSNSGYAGGIGGQRTNYDYVTIATLKDSNQVITAYPSGATPKFPKEYAWLFEGKK